MLKLKVPKIEDVEELYRTLYKEVGDEFVLDLEGYQDPGALLRAKDHEKKARQTAEQSLKELRTEFDTFRTEVEQERDDKNRKGGKVEDLDKSWQAKYDRREAELKADIDKRDIKIKTLLVDHVADAMAAELSDTPELLGEIIRKRLTVEDGANGPETRVLDANGTLSATTVDELKTEFKSNKKYAAIIRGSQASGGGAAGGGGGAGGLNKSFKDMSESERTDLAKKDPVAYNREFEAYKVEAKRAANA